MDGNGRWAERRGRARAFGHVCGAKTARWMIRRCARLKLPFLSLFALSAENALRRPRAEVKNLKSLLEKVFLKRAKILMEENIRLHILGDLSVFSGQLKALCHSLCENTKKNKGLELVVALNYGGRQEMVQAVQQIAREVEKRRLKAESVDEALLSSFLSSSNFPPPDLIIRTGAKCGFLTFIYGPPPTQSFISQKLYGLILTKAISKRLLKAFHRRKGVLAKLNLKSASGAALARRWTAGFDKKALLGDSF